MRNIDALGFIVHRRVNRIRVDASLCSPYAVCNSGFKVEKSIKVHCDNSILIIMNKLFLRNMFALEIIV